MSLGDTSPNKRGCRFPIGLVGVSGISGIINPSGKMFCGPDKGIDYNRVKLAALIILKLF